MARIVETGAMTVMVALLRGVNVGGRGLLPMADLRRIVADLGHTDVRTYIQSGNVVFESDVASTDAVAADLAAAITAGSEVAPAVMVRRVDELAAAVRADPFVARGEDSAKVHLTFYATLAPDPGDLGRFAPDTAVPIGREMHLFLPGGMGRSKLAASLDRSVAPGGTTRNWRTVTTLLEMAGRPS
jgi:uncharacterized protein (DUF1697 family)